MDKMQRAQSRAHKSMAHGVKICNSTPLLHKDVVESTVCPHQKAVSTFLRITSKGHSWIDPGDDIDLTAIPLWVRAVSYTHLTLPTKRIV